LQQEVPYEGDDTKWREARKKHKRSIIATLNKYKSSAWKRGDILVIKGIHDYRNEGLYFWNGTTVIEPETSYDDYGSIPKEFKVGDEFHAQYWNVNDHIIDHNSAVYVRFDKSIADMVKSAAKDMKKTYDDKERMITFVFNRVKWCLVFNVEYEWPEGAILNSKGEGVLFYDGNPESAHNAERLDKAKGYGVKPQHILLLIDEHMY
jgi:hypothetical protein